MVKNFFEYVKELIPEKGSVFFEGYNHTTKNDISLYQLADLLCGKKIKFATDIVAYTWKIREIWDYPFETVGLLFFYNQDDGDNYYEKWIHFSKNAFIGAICIVATRNGITFDDEEHEQLRQTWARKLENKETEEDKKITNREEDESNFDDICFVNKPNIYKTSRNPEEHIKAELKTNAEYAKIRDLNRGVIKPLEYYIKEFEDNYEKYKEEYILNQQKQMRKYYEHS